MPSRRSRLLVAALALTALAASACTQASGTEGKGYVTADGIVVEVPVADRADPVEVSGETLEGDPYDVADDRGEVVVVNVWGSWCSPCRTETPVLVDAYDELPPGARMVGINIRDDREDALAFERSFEVPWPSLDDPGSETLLGFPPPYNPRDTPSTIVLDREGRVAALIRGAVPSKTTLTTLVDEVAAEGSPEGSAGG